MFVTVGRFQFRPMSQGEWQSMLQGVEREFEPLPREFPGFRGIYLTRPNDDELMLIWLWESAAHWEAALPRFGPFLQQHDVPNLSRAPERIGGDTVLQIVA
jgi:hypothetical protein